MWRIGLVIYLAFIGYAGAVGGWKTALLLAGVAIVLSATVRPNEIGALITQWAVRYIEASTERHSRR